MLAIRSQFTAPSSKTFRDEELLLVQLPGTHGPYERPFLYSTIAMFIIILFLLYRLD
jgi:hypothetical protein